MIHVVLCLEIHWDSTLTLDMTFTLTFYVESTVNSSFNPKLKNISNFTQSVSLVVYIDA